MDFGDVRSHKANGTLDIGRLLLMSKGVDIGYALDNGEVEPLQRLRSILNFIKGMSFKELANLLELKDVAIEYDGLKPILVIEGSEDDYQVDNENFIAFNPSWKYARVDRNASEEFEKFWPWNPKNIYIDPKGEIHEY